MVQLATECMTQKADDEHRRRVRHGGFHIRWNIAPSGSRLG
jgi:hypothetical protein